MKGGGGWGLLAAVVGGKEARNGKVAHRLIEKGLAAHACFRTSFHHPPLLHAQRIAVVVGQRVGERHHARIVHVAKGQAHGAHRVEEWVHGAVVNVHVRDRLAEDDLVVGDRTCPACQT